MNDIYTETTRAITNGFAAVGMEMYILGFVLILILVGGKKIPELMRGVGKGVGELQKGLEEGKRGIAAPVEPSQIAAPVNPPVATPVAEAEARPEPPKTA